MNDQRYIYLLFGFDHMRAGGGINDLVDQFYVGSDAEAIEKAKESCVWVDFQCCQLVKIEMPIVKIIEFNHD